MLQKTSLLQNVPDAQAGPSPASHMTFAFSWGWPQKGAEVDPMGPHGSITWPLIHVPYLVTGGSADGQLAYMIEPEVQQNYVSVY